MQIQKQKIDLFVARDFGQKFDATFSFLKQNARAVFKFFFYIALPLALLQSSLTLTVLSSNILNPAIGEMAQNLPDNFALIIVNSLTSAVSGLLITLLMYSCMQLYLERKEGLQGVTFKEIAARMWAFFKRGLSLFIVGVILMACGLAGYIGAVFALAQSGAGVFLFIFLFMAVMFVFVPALILLIPTCLWQKISLGKAIGQSVKMGFSNWGSIVGFCLVMGIVTYILQLILSIPFFILTILGLVFGKGGVVGDGFLPIAGYSLLSYLTTILATLGNYLAMAVSALAVLFLYGDVMEKTKGVSLSRDIDTFEHADGEEQTAQTRTFDAIDEFDNH